jgi:tRNA (guanine37-N1)-methyltransferase
MRFDVLTLFPELFSSFLKETILGRAVKAGLVDIRLVNIRSFAKGRHLVTDDRPFGGGEGMVMKPGPVLRALESIDRTKDRSLVLLLTPQGRTFDQPLAWELSRMEQIILICGRYEGVDERIRTSSVALELSIGDYVLSGGEMAAMVVMDAVSRLVPGVLGGERSAQEDSFEEGLLEYPQYTRPRVFKNKEVPAVLLSGDHEKIRVWRRTESLKRTLERRPDLLEKAKLTEEDKRILAKLRQKLES